MKRFIGMWISNRKAMIVSVTEGQEQHQICESCATRRIRLPGEPKGLSPTKGEDAKYHEDMRLYFQEVLETVKDAEAIYIFGPGIAKDTLKRVMMESGGLGSKIVEVEAADKMTENQIIAKVKGYFFPKKPAEQAG